MDNAEKTIMVTIPLERFEDLLDTETRVFVLKKLINDDREHRTYGLDSVSHRELASILAFQLSPLKTKDDSVCVK